MDETHPDLLVVLFEASATGTVRLISTLNFAELIHANFLPAATVQAASVFEANSATVDVFTKQRLKTGLKSCRRPVLQLLVLAFLLSLFDDGNVSRNEGVIECI